MVGENITFLKTSPFFVRSKEKYICLLEHVNSHDCALQSQIGDIKLQIYTSKQLPADSEGKFAFYLF